MPQLEVNVDHVATLRQARLIDEPDPVTAAALAELAGADGIIVLTWTVAGTVEFRRTLSPLGTRIGSRQAQKVE